MMQPPRADAAETMRAANAWTVGLARQYPKRFAAFISVDPLRVDDALAEIAHWRGNRDVTGLKLHLTAAGADLRKGSDVAALARVFRAAARAHWPVVIHLRTMRMDYGAEDARRFIEDVLPAAQGTPVQIAHAAGWGGIDQPTLAALGAFADAMAAHRERYRNLRFDLSGVAAGTASAAERQAMAALIRKIGIAHFLPGSDWPYNGADLAGYYARALPNVPLTAQEWAIIRGNIAPYARQDGT
jgi:predicted TIM-barrel fold metal-dependent hydrolase